MSDAHQSHDMHGGRHNRAGHRDDRTAGETDLRAQDRHGGHGAHGGNHGDHVALFRRLFWINLALTVPAVLLSGMFADLLGYSQAPAGPDRYLSRWCETPDQPG